MSAKLSTKILVCSIPKSGTHLLGNIFDKLTLQSSGLFLHGDLAIYDNNENFMDNRKKLQLFKEGQTFYFEHTLQIQAEKAIKLLPPHTYTFSHLTPKNVPYYLLPIIQVIFPVRKIRDSLVSAFNAECEVFQRRPSAILPQHFNGVPEAKNKSEKFKVYLDNYCKKEIGFYIDLMYWDFYKNVLPIRFEDLIAPDKGLDVLNNIANFLHLPEVNNIDYKKEILDVDTATLNKNTNNFNIREWNDEHEKVFRKHAWHELADWVDKKYYSNL